LTPTPITLDAPAGRGGGLGLGLTLVKRLAELHGGTAVAESAGADRGSTFALEAMGCEVSEAHDGPNAVAAIDRLEPDVAIVDLGLPGFDGVEVARRVRAVQGGRSGSSR
jgi:DNA-binding NarL/FixJ family response regulator